MSDIFFNNKPNTHQIMERPFNSKGENPSKADIIWLAAFIQDFLSSCRWR